MGRFGERLLDASLSYARGSMGFGLFLTWFYCCFNTVMLIPFGVRDGLFEVTWGLVMCAATVFALAWLRVRACPPTFAAVASGAGTLLVYGGFANVATGALLVITIQFAREFSLETMARWAFPIVALACAFVVAEDGRGYAAASIANGVAIFVVHLFFWVVAAKGSAVFGANGRAFLCWGVAAICAGKVVGVAAGSVLVAHVDAAAMPTAVLLGLACLVAVVMATAPGAGRLLAADEAPDVSSAQPPVSLHDVFAAQARVLAVRYGLSRREEEVLALLLAGRNRPYMRDTLSVSINTINTHCRRIFAKLGVHSQQEAVELAHREADAG